MFYRNLKRILIHALICLMGVPITLVLLFASSGRALAAEDLSKPVLSKIIVIQNSQGADETVSGIAGAVSPQSTVEVSLASSFSRIIGTVQASEDGSFSRISLGDNLASEFFLRSKSDEKVSSWVSFKNDITAPALYSIGGFAPDRTYRQGENLDLRFSYGEANLNVWAEIGQLDSSFPATQKLTYIDNGTWALIGPTFSVNLDEGTNFLKVSASDKAGNVLTESVRVVLKKLSSPVINSVTIDSKNNLTLSWRPVSLAQDYLVVWQVQNGEVEGGKIVNAGYHQTQFRVLEPGTFYNISVAARDNAYQPGPPAQEIIQSQGIAAKKAVAGQTIAATTVSSGTSKIISPAIGTGVATVSPKIAQKTAEETPPQVTTVTSSPSASPQEETQKGGLNRLLVALGILIIAAGAAIGGYYGYEWWSGKQEKGEKPPSSESSSRW